MVFPVMLLFLILIVDFGLALDRKIVLQNAVREGARHGATGASVQDIQRVTAEQVGITEDKVSVCYSDADGNGRTGNVGDDVRVGANVSYHLTLGGSDMLKVFGVPEPSFAMEPSANMRLENTVREDPSLVCPP